MFLGVTPGFMASWLYKELARIKPKVGFVPFAGNFTVEQILSKMEVEVHSTDISLYSRAIGYGATNQSSEIELKEDLKIMFPSFAGPEPIELAKAVIFFQEVAQVLKNQDKPYYKRVADEARRDQHKYYAAISAKVHEFAEGVKGMKFYGNDAVEMMKGIKKGDWVYLDPPTVDQGYEKMFKDLEGCFNFVMPPYTDINEAVMADILSDLHERGANVYYRRHNESDCVPKTYHEVFRYQADYDYSYRIYSNDKKSGSYVDRRTIMNDVDPHFPVISSEDEITAKSKISVIQIKDAESAHYRLMWVKNAWMKSAGVPFAVMVDGKLIGVISLRSGMAFSLDFTTIISDPAAPTSRYSRLGKLVLLITCTQEMLDMLNDITMWEHKSFTTVVTSNHPVSMKYRGLFNLAERRPSKNPSFKNELIYRMQEPRHKTFKAGLREWVDKHGKELV